MAAAQGISCMLFPIKSQLLSWGFMAEAVTRKRLVCLLVTCILSGRDDTHACVCQRCCSGKLLLNHMAGAICRSEKGRWQKDLSCTAATQACCCWCSGGPVLSLRELVSHLSWHTAHASSSVAPDPLLSRLLALAGACEACGR